MSAASTESWAAQFTPESPVPRLRMPALAYGTTVDDLAYWEASAKAKRGKKGAFKKAADAEGPAEMPSTVTSEPADFAKWPAIERSESLNNTESLHEVIRALAEKVEELSSKSKSTMTPSPPLPPLLNTSFIDAPLPTYGSGKPKPSYRTVPSGIDAMQAGSAETWKSFPSKPRLPDFDDPRLTSSGAKTVPYRYAPNESRDIFYTAPPLVPRATVIESSFISETNRSRPRGSQRYRSRSPSSSTSSDRSSFVGRRPQKANYHADLIPCSETGEVNDDDLVATIVPFSRKVYVSYHEATSVDFKLYLTLLKYAQPDCWYSMPDQIVVNAIREWENVSRLQGEHGIEANRKKIQEIMSPLNSISSSTRVSHGSPETSAEITRINVGRALRIVDDEEPDCKCKQRVRPLDRKLPKCEMKPCTRMVCECKQSQNLVWYPCADCKDEQRLPRSRVSEMTYLSVVQSYHDSYPPGTGAPVYKVVHTGSRRAAAAQAFFDAGAHGWSTVFVCAVPAQVSVLSETCKFPDVVGLRHAKSIDEVLVHEKYYGKDWMRILY